MSSPKETKVLTATELEMQAGRERQQQHAEAYARTLKDKAEREAAEANVLEIDEDPVLMRPFVAGQKLVAPTPVTLDETDEERAEREALVLEEEKAKMTARLGGNPDPAFDPDHIAAQRAKDDAETAAKNKLAEEEAAATAAVKARIMATASTNVEGTTPTADTKAKAKTAKAKEGEEKTGEPTEDGGGTTDLDALLNG